MEHPKSGVYAAVNTPDNTDEETLPKDSGNVPNAGLPMDLQESMTLEC